MKPLISIADAFTGQTVVREMTDEEFAAYEADNIRRDAKVAQRLQEEESKRIAREKVLDRLGVTEEEAKLLLS